MALVQKFLLQIFYPAISHRMTDARRVAYLSSNKVCKFVQKSIYKLRVPYNVRMVCETEQGVHCLQNHLLIEFKDCEKRFLPSKISEMVRYDLPRKSDIFIKSCRRLPDDFNVDTCVESREFIYRISQLNEKVSIPMAGRTSMAVAANDRLLAMAANDRLLAVDYNLLKHFPVNEVGKSHFLLLKNLPSINESVMSEINQASKRVMSEGFIQDFSIKRLSNDPLVPLNENYKNITTFEMYVKTNDQSLDTKEVRRIFSLILWEGMRGSLKRRILWEGMRGSLKRRQESDGKDWEEIGSKFILPVEGLYLEKVSIKSDN